MQVHSDDTAAKRKKTGVTAPEQSTVLAHQDCMKPVHKTLQLITSTLHGRSQFGVY